MCTREKLTRPIGVMDLNLFKKIVDECKEHKVKTLHLHNFGEPLLDPLLIDRIKYAKEAGIRLRIFSNFSVLTEEKALSLIDSGIDEIKISIDGATKETYEAIRRNLSFEQVEANIEMMLRLRKEMNAACPRIRLVFVATDKNYMEVEDFKKRWQGRVDDVLISSYHNWAGGLDKEGEIRKRLLPCFRIWRTFTVLCDGRVALCCLDYDGKIILGDLNNQTIKEIYHGSKLKEIQRNHLNWEYKKIPMCLDCEGRR
jgi:MoaA/NifB/PqqE/SkfB family radical SAM enzyme